MGQVLHPSATTTAAVRRAIQHSQESLRTLAKRHGINPKTVAKWKARGGGVKDRRPGPKNPGSSVLSAEQEAAVVAFRRHTLLPLDDCLYALQPSLPHLTRSSLYRCLQRHGISRLPETADAKVAKKRFKTYPVAYFHIDIAEVRTAEGKLYLLVAVDRTSKFAFVELHGRVTLRVAGDFLRHLIAAVPYRVHTVLTDNGIHFTTPGNVASAAPLIREAMDRGELFRAHSFELACAQNHIDHRLTKPRHPWTNGQVERMNRTLKEATVRRYHYETHAQLRQHLSDFVAAYNYARRLKTLKGLTPYEYICKIWTSEPHRFKLDPLHQMPGLNMAKIAGQPLFRLLAERHGRQADPRVFVYAVGGYYHPGKGVEQLRVEMRGYLDRGYTVVKMKIGNGLEEDRSRIEGVLAELDGQAQLAVDANGRLTLEQGTAYAKMLRDYPLFWYEEVGDPLDFALQAALAEFYPGPIARAGIYSATRTRAICCATGGCVPTATGCNLIARCPTGCASTSARWRC